MPTNDFYSPIEKAQCVLLFAQYQLLEKARTIFYRENGKKTASSRPEMLVNTWNEVKIRLEMLRENGGRHVEG